MSSIARRDKRPPAKVKARQTHERHATPVNDENDENATARLALMLDVKTPCNLNDERAAQATTKLPVMLEVKTPCNFRYPAASTNPPIKARI